MRTSIGRLTLVVLLLIAGGAAGYIAWIARDAAQGRVDAADSTLRTVDRINDAVGAIASAQSGYLAPVANTQVWLDAATASLQQITTDFDTLRGEIGPAAASTAVQDLQNSVDRLLDADARARAALAAGDIATATRIVFDEAPAARTAVLASLHDIGADEIQAAAFARARGDRQQVTALAVGAGLWVLGLLALVRVPTSTAAVGGAPPDPLTLHQDTQPEPGRPALAAPTSRSVPPESQALRSSPVDLAAAAALCIEISRLTSADALEILLARAATILDASGVIVWMGAGDELFAARAHGYEPQMLARLGPIPRSAENATAAAWRTGELRTVAGGGGSDGAIVAPMFGPEACIGVFAAEVRHGLEAETDAHAVSSIVAAQLATVLGAWPAASTAHDPSPQSSEP